MYGCFKTDISPPFRQAPENGAGIGLLAEQGPRGKAHEGPAAGQPRSVRFYTRRLDGDLITEPLK